LDFKISLTFGQGDQSFTVFTAFDAQRCDLRNLLVEVGTVVKVANENGAELCDNDLARFLADAQSGVKDFCSNLDAPYFEFPLSVKQDITPTVDGSEKFGFEASLEDLLTGAQGQPAGEIVGGTAGSFFGTGNWLRATGTDVVFKFKDVVTMFTGIRFKLELDAFALDVNKAALCANGDPGSNRFTCAFLSLVVAGGNPSNSILYNEENIDVGLFLYSLVGENQDFLTEDGEFLVGTNSAACQIKPDPFVLTLDDASSPPQPNGQSLSDYVSISPLNERSFLDAFGTALQNEINSNCLPPGYNIDPDSMKLQTSVVNPEDELLVHGDMFASAGKNPAGLLDCVEIIQRRDTILKAGGYSVRIAKVEFTQGPDECDEEHEKYFACDGDAAPLQPNRTVSEQEKTDSQQTAVPKIPIAGNKNASGTGNGGIIPSVGDVDVTQFLGADRDTEIVMLVVVVITGALLAVLLVGFAIWKVTQRAARLAFYKRSTEDDSKFIQSSRLIVSPRSKQTGNRASTGGEHKEVEDDGPSEDDGACAVHPAPSASAAAAFTSEPSPVDDGGLHSFVTSAELSV